MTTFQPHLPNGQELAFEGRALTFVRDLGDGMLHILDEDGSIFKVPTCDGAYEMPTWNWLFLERNSGSLIIPDSSRNADSERLRMFLGMDLHACAERDFRSPWKWSWAERAIQANAPRSKSLENWIKQQPLLATPHQVTGLSAVVAQYQKKPKWRSLVNWINKHQRYGGLPGAHVTQAGRKLGFSQLPPVDDAYVEGASDLYWKDRRLSTKVEAGALAARWRKQYVSEGNTDGIGARMPSRQAVCYRINKKENAENVARREGKWKSDKLYKANEEPVAVTRCFERIFIDGTQNEHLCQYSENWRIPSPAMKSVHAMDAFSQYLFPFPSFTGPYRAEMGIIALMAVFSPPEMSDAEVEAEPWRTLVYDTPDLVMYDNDKAQLPPNLVPSLSLHSTVELAKPYHSNAKARLERYFRYEKLFLRGYGGRVKGPEFLRDPAYDPLKDVELTRSQYAAKKEEARRRWNAKPKRSLGWRSPDDVMRQFVEARR